MSFAVFLTQFKHFTNRYAK